MNAAEFAQLQNDRYYFSSIANQTKPLEEYPYPDPLALGTGTNWTQEITRRAPYQNLTCLPPAVIKPRSITSLPTITTTRVLSGTAV